jgi:hypothetical protein
LFALQFRQLNVANDNNMLLNIVEESLTVNKDIKSGEQREKTVAQAPLVKGPA